ncbi:unnamed protein product, partial [marine sediment metagenome]
KLGHACECTDKAPPIKVVVDTPEVEKVDKSAPKKTTVIKKETVPKVVEPIKEEVDPFGAPINNETTVTTEKPVDAIGTQEVEAPIVEGGNTMTKNFDIAAAEPKEALPIVDDTEDLFNC